MLRFAILLTSYNRRETTLASLRAIGRQELDPQAVALEIFLVDDGSTDGTADAVRSEFPEVHLIRGDGSLFWSGGMRVAFAEAMRTGFDYYLWLNDDTLLEDDALARLLQVHRSLPQEDAIAVGSVADASTGTTTYGGVVRRSRWKRHWFCAVTPGTQPIECETMNGNCVLIPAAVARRVGNLDPAFTHGISDFDYGLRARKLGIRVLVAPGFVGTCGRNSISGTWRDPALPLPVRLRKARTPKGLPPREWLTFVRRHTGPLWMLYWISPYLTMVTSSLRRPRDTAQL